MVIAVAIMLGFISIAGLGLAISAFLWRGKELDRQKYVETRRVYLLRGMSSFFIGGSAVLLLLTGNATPFEIIMAIPLLLFLFYIAARVRFHDIFRQFEK